MAKATDGKHVTTKLFPEEKVKDAAPEATEEGKETPEADQASETSDAAPQDGEAGESEAPAEKRNLLPAALAGDLPPKETDADELTLAHYAARAYLEYALSVVKSRALPDVVDGMKPVQRRILYAMQRLHLTASDRFSKSARVVGDVIGKYHPHGDQAAYDAMVRMAQPFSMRYPLVDGKGNFGSRDGDGPAAMRYTEVRLQKAASLLLDEIDSEDVEFLSNYDGTLKEPAVLPAKLPLLLLNGASGIAVGMATEIPPHNLTEVADAVLLLLAHPDATLDDILENIPAPDFPGGGQIITSPAEIRAAYASGRGSFRVRARYHFEDLQRGQWQLVIDELPPAASAEGVLSEIEEITNPKPKAGKKALTADQQQTKSAMLAVLERVRNECSKDEPVRLVFEPKTSRIDRDLFVNTLLAQTSLESNAPINLVMIGTDGRPAQKGLRTVLSEWVNARMGIVRARTDARLKKVLARLHILQGRVICCDNIERVIEIIRFEEKPAEVLAKEFNLSEEQVADILDLRLRQIANLEYERIHKEIKTLEAEKAELEKILGDEKVLKRLIAKETKEAVKAFGDERRTLVEAAKKAVVEQVVTNDPVTVVISQKGFVRSRTGHGHDASLMNFKVGDDLLVSLECMTTDTLVAVASDGRTYSTPVAQLPGARGDGLPLTSFFDIDAKTEIVGYLAGKGEEGVVFAADNGFGLKCRLSDLFARVRSGKAFMRPDEGAKLLAPQVIGKETPYLACLSGEGRLLVFDLSELRELRGGGKGVILMDLNPGEKLLAVLTAGDTGCIVSGKGRSTVRQKTLVKADWQQQFGHRARKGRPLPIRFAAQMLSAIPTQAAGGGEAAAQEEEPEPTLF